MSNKEAVKISLSNVRVAKINAYIVEHEEDDAEEITLKRKTSHELEPGRNQSHYRITVSEQLKFEPTGPFVLELDTVADIGCSESVEEEELKGLEEQFAEAVMGFNSLVVGFITEKLTGGPPIIIPPFIENQEQTGEDSTNS